MERLRSAGRRHELNQCAFEVAHAAAHGLDEEVEAVIGNAHAPGGRLAAQDVAPYGGVGRLDLRHQARGDLRTQPCVETLDVAREPIAGERHTQAGVHEMRERVEELELGGGLRVEELQVFDHQ